jgi:hypothetical protein
MMARHAPANEKTAENAYLLQTMETLSRELNPPRPEYELLAAAGGGPLVPKEALPEIEARPRHMGGVTKAATMAWREAMNPNNSWGDQVIFGALSIAAMPAAGLESLLYAPFNVEPAANELGQVLGRASLQTDPFERNQDILRGVSLGSEGFTSAGAWFVGPQPKTSFTQSTGGVAATRTTYTNTLAGGANKVTSLIVPDAPPIGTVLPQGERLSIYYRSLQNAPAATNAQEGFNLMSNTMHAVEDAYSGVTAVTNPGLAYQGRMYPPRPDYVVTNANGSLTATTKGSQIQISTDGSITISKFNWNTKTVGDLVLHKPGKR